MPPPAAKLARPAKDSGVAPAPFKRTPGFIPVGVPRIVNGVGLDRRDAERHLADKPYAAHLRFLGLARGKIWFEYDPAKVRAAQEAT